jgi:hypothetical protein
MHCCDTNSTLPAIHLEHLDVKTATRLNEKIGRLKGAHIWNAVIRLFLNGGHIDEKIETSKVITLDN